MKRSRHDQTRRVLGRVRREEFVGRTAELARIVSHAGAGGDQPGLLLLLAPLAGVSELLRQAYDELFNQRGETVPIYFSLPRAEQTSVSAAIEFLNSFLTQYVAFRRNEPALCQASLTLGDVLQYATSSDAEWIEKLISAYDQHRFGNDDRELIRFCLNAPRRIPVRNGRAFVMLDVVQLSSYANSIVPLGNEIVKSLSFSGFQFVLAGLRREILQEVERVCASVDQFKRLDLDPLTNDEAALLVTSVVARQQVSLNEETRDLLVQQMQGSPFLMMAMLQAAHDKHVALDSYLAFERLYVDELLGGRLNRYFATSLEDIVPDVEIRRTIVRLLCEAVPAGNRNASVTSWKRQLELEPPEAEEILRRLHVHELINRDGDNIAVETQPAAWRDFLRSRFRLDALSEPRALVVADVIGSSLKRAPQTISSHFRRAASLRLREVVGAFNTQLVPRILFDYEHFADSYKGATVEETAGGLDADTRFIRLPQVFHVASAASFSRDMSQFGEEASIVAHGFEGATYRDENEIVWLAAELESKLEVDTELATEWVKRLEALARTAGVVRTQIWLLSNEGFSTDAATSLRERGVFFSSKQQFEILAERLGQTAAASVVQDTDEIELVLPMGSDYELLAANTVEQMARRLNFRQEAINQIKTAIVEACINASEHSHSPDRKIYQRFRAENDRLVVTIASRGIVPSNLNGQPAPKDPSSDQRRGWGLKLIKTLMDEVEFERVDEGTSLRMTKYLRA